MGDGEIESSNEPDRATLVTRSTPVGANDLDIEVDVDLFSLYGLGAKTHRFNLRIKPDRSSNKRSEIAFQSPRSTIPVVITTTNFRR